MGVLDREYRGWGCLSVQALVGGLALWTALSSESSRWRYGKAAALLFGTVFLAVVALRVAANLFEAFVARPRLGSVMLVVGLGLVAAAVVVQRERLRGRQASQRLARLQRYQTIRIGMTAAEVEARLGNPTGWGAKPDVLDDSCTTAAGSPDGAVTFVAWSRPDGHHDTFVAYDSTGRVAHTCFAIHCAWRDAGGKCQRYDP